MCPEREAPSVRRLPGSVSLDDHILRDVAVEESALVVHRHLRGKQCRHGRPASEWVCQLAEAGRGWSRREAGRGWRPPRARSGAGGACWGAHWPTPLGGGSPHSYSPHAEVDAELAMVEELAQRLPQSVGGRSGLGLGLGSGLETGFGFGLVPAPLRRTAGSACRACCPQGSSRRRASSQGCPPSCGGG